MVLGFSRRGLAGAAGAGALAAAGVLAGAGAAHAATAAQKPAKVHGFAVENGTVTTDGATFHWAGDAGARSYRIVIVNASTPTALASFDRNYTLKGTSVTVSTLGQGITYEAKISAEDSAGASEWSPWVLFSTSAAPGGQGARGPQGPRGPQGRPGPSGVVSTKTYTLASDPYGDKDSITTGGGFTSHEQLVKAVTLAAGTYLLNVNFMATPNDITRGAVFPQFFVYDGAPAAHFSNDLFNVGSGALAPYNSSDPNDQINSYYSGSDEITVPSGGETLDVYAFGYDGDHGAGAYELNYASLTATALAPAGR